MDEAFKVVLADTDLKVSALVDAGAPEEDALDVARGHIARSMTAILSVAIFQAFPDETEDKPAKKPKKRAKKPEPDKPAKQKTKKRKRKATG